EIQVAISRTEAEEELSKFIKNKGFPEYYSKQWLKDLLKYHLIHLEGNDKIAFRHQLIQEYYTAEELKKKLPNLRDEQLQWDYLNYLKWTEPMALLLGLLDNETQAKRVVKLGLEIDLKLGARLAGEVNFKFQKQTVGLVLGLDVPKRFKVKLLGLTKSNEVVNELSQALEDSNEYVRGKAVEALGNIGTETAIAGLLKALEDSNRYVRRKAAAALGNIDWGRVIAASLKYFVEIGSETAIPRLLKTLEHPNKYIRREAAEALGNIGSETAMTELIKCLKNPDFVTLNNGDTLSPAREALDTIQNKLKYYHPLSQPMNQQVYISYNWQEDSNEMANQLVQAFAAKGIEIIRDKTHTSYKDSIKNFMRQIGQGKCVVAVISDRYLKSENCMFELVEIARNGDFYQRIFPIILPDARIHKDFERIDYLKYWEDEKAKLQAKYKEIDLAKTNSIMATLNLYDEIRSNIDNLTNILKDMNTLNIDLHRQSEFAAMIQAVETKLAEDSQNI
ncbi:MAG: HEAT repeat domain-containing protein, partial [Microcystis panniformis]